VVAYNMDGKSSGAWYYYVWGSILLASGIYYCIMFCCGYKEMKSAGEL